MRIPCISLLAAGALSLGGCAYGDLGLGLGYGGGYGPYDYYGSPYGYGGYGYGGYGYGDPWYGGLGYGSSSYGWYGDYYYPGTGYYVYDRYRRPRSWTTSERRYWTSRQRLTSSTSTVVRNRPNWSGFNRTHPTSRHAIRSENRNRRPD